MQKIFLCVEGIQKKAKEKWKKKNWKNIYFFFTKPILNIINYANIWGPLDHSEWLQRP